MGLSSSLSLSLLDEKDAPSSSRLGSGNGHPRRRRQLIHLLDARRKRRERERRQLREKREATTATTNANDNVLSTVLYYEYVQHTKAAAHGAKKRYSGIGVTEFLASQPVQVTWLCVNWNKACLMTREAPHTEQPRGRPHRLSLLQPYFYVCDLDFLLLSSRSQSRSRFSDPFLPFPRPAALSDTIPQVLCLPSPPPHLCLDECALFSQHCTVYTT